MYGVVKLWVQHSISYKLNLLITISVYVSSFEWIKIVVMLASMIIELNKILIQNNNMILKGTFEIKNKVYKHIESIKDN